MVTTETDLVCLVPAERGDDIITAGGGGGGVSGGGGGGQQPQQKDSEHSSHDSSGSQTSAPGGPRLYSLSGPPPLNARWGRWGKGHRRGSTLQSGGQRPQNKQHSYI